MLSGAPGGVGPRGGWELPSAAPMWGAGSPTATAVDEKCLERQRQRHAAVPGARRALTGLGVRAAALPLPHVHGNGLLTLLSPYFLDISSCREAAAMGLRWSQCPVYPGQQTSPPPLCCVSADHWPGLPPTRHPAQPAKIPRRAGHLGDPGWARAVGMAAQRSGVLTRLLALPSVLPSPGYVQSHGCETGDPGT